MRRLLAATAVLGVVMLGCGSSDDVENAVVQPQQQRPPTWSAPDGMPCGTLSTAPATTTVGRYVVGELATLSATPAVDGGQVWGHYLAYTTKNRRATVCDLDTGLVATIAVAPDDSGLVQRPVGSQDTVVYTRLSGVPQVGSSKGTPWTVEAVDLRTGVQWSIDKSEDETSPDTEFGNLPLPHVDWPWVAWLRPKDAKDSQVWSFDLRSGERRVVATLPTGGRIDLADGVVVYDHSTSSDYLERDLYSVPADGSREPKRLFTMPGGQWPLVDSKWIAWDDKVAPPVPPSTPAQYDSWVYSLEDGGDPVRLSPGGGAQPGRGFVLSSSDHSLKLYDPNQPTEPPAVFFANDEGGPFVSLAHVWQDVILWKVTDVNAKAETLHLVRVTAAPTPGCGTGEGVVIDSSSTTAPLPKGCVLPSPRQ